MGYSETIKTHCSGHYYVHTDPASRQKALFLQQLAELLADCPQLSAFSGNSAQESGLSQG